MKKIVTVAVLYTLCTRFLQTEMYAKSSHAKHSKEPASLYTKPQARPSIKPLTQRPKPIRPMGLNNDKPGTLNKNFGPQGTGMVTTHFSGIAGGSEISDLKIIPEQDDEIITIGSNGPANKFIVASYDKNGDLNEDFGDRGHVTFEGTGAPLNTVATLEDFIIGDASSGSMLVNKHGGGWQTGFIRHLNPSIMTARAMATDSHHRVVSAGFVGNENVKMFALKRTLGDGTLDETFGDNGMVISPFSNTPNSLEEIHDIAATADNKYIVVGQTLIQQLPRFVLARFTAQGALDTTFGTAGTGKIVTSFTPITGENTIANDNANAVVIQPDGKIVVVGYTPGNAPLGGLLMATARYTTNGTLDLDYGNRGITANRIGQASHTEATDVILDADNNIVIAGTTRNTTGGTPAAAYQFIVVRHRPDGGFDTRFGTNGAVRTHFPDAPANFPNTEKLSVANTLSINAEGKITVAGYTHDRNGNLIDAIASYNA